jgi:AcrR family transcriptional regulator
MQTLKDEVRHKILEAAKEEFLINGYENSSLRTIAAQAGITIGNIYSYFSSKDDLFENVVSPSWEDINKLMAIDFPSDDAWDAPDLINITNNICNVFFANKEPFLILINGSKGSKFENAGQDVIDFLSRKIQAQQNPQDGKGFGDPLFAKAVASALFAGFITIFFQYGGDEERLFSLVRQMLYVVASNMKNL